MTLNTIFRVIVVKPYPNNQMLNFNNSFSMLIFEKRSCLSCDGQFLHHQFFGGLVKFQHVFLELDLSNWQFYKPLLVFNFFKSQQHIDVAQIETICDEITFIIMTKSITITMWKLELCTPLLLSTSYKLTPNLSVTIKAPINLVQRCCGANRYYLPSYDTWKTTKNCESL